MMDRLTREEIENIRRNGVHAIRFNERTDKVIELCDLALQSLSQEAVRDEVLEEALEEALTNWWKWMCVGSLDADPEKLIADEERIAQLRALKREPNAAAQIPHGVCRADDPNREATLLPDGSVGLPYKAAATAATPGTSERGEAVSVSDDRSGTRISAPAAPDVVSMVKRLLKRASDLGQIGHEEATSDADLMTTAAALLARLGQGWVPGWDFIVASLEHERERNHTAAGMFPQTAEEHREFDKAFLEIIEHIRWARDRGMPLPPAPGASDD